MIWHNKIYYYKHYLCLMLKATFATGIYRKFYIYMGMLYTWPYPVSVAVYVHIDVCTFIFGFWRTKMANSYLYVWILRLILVRNGSFWNSEKCDCWISSSYCHSVGTAKNEKGVKLALVVMFYSLLSELKQLDALCPPLYCIWSYVFFWGRSLE